MNSLLLVDDERHVLDTLRNYVDWVDMGFEVVGTAKNGREALRMTKELQPDIVMTDVKMPIMDGIEYARAARIMFPQMKMIFLSGYDEFNYVKSALEVEASGYLLKPLNMEELRKLMVLVKEKCSEEQRIKQSSIALAVQYMKELLLAGSSEERSSKVGEIVKLGEQYFGYPTHTNSLFFTLITIDEFRFLSGYEPQGEKIVADIRQRIKKVAKEIKILVVDVDERQFLMSSPYPFAEPILKWYRNLGVDSPWMSVCVEAEPTELNELPKVWKRLLGQRNAHVFHYGPGHYIATASQDIEESKLNNEMKAHSNLEEGMAFIRQGQREDFSIWIGNYLRVLSSMDSDIDQLHGVHKAALDLLDMIYEDLIIPHKGIGEQIEDKTALYNKLAVIESLPLIERVMRSFVVALMDAIRDAHTDKHTHTINLLKELIGQQYDRSLTIEYLAEQVYISPNYLRTIFKERTGNTVLEYLTQVRMSQASELLRNSQLKIHEISTRVGYENASHFCAIFLKKTGMTPNQFRNQMARL